MADSNPDYRHGFEVDNAHAAGISCVRFSPCGSWIASASGDGTGKIWKVDAEAPACALVVTLKGHTQGINDLAWSPDSKLIATASDDKAICLWSTCTGELMKILEGHTAAVFCITFSPHGNAIATGSFDETVRMWSVKTGELVRTINAHSDPVTGVVFNPTADKIASCSYDGLVRLWEAETGQCLLTLVGNADPPVSGLTFAPNGLYLLSSSLDSKIRLWNTTDGGSCIKSYVGHTNTRYCMQAGFVTVGPTKYIASGSEDNSIILWDLNRKEVVQVLTGHTDVPLMVNCHPTRHLLVSGGSDRDARIILWIAPNAQIASLQ